MTAHYGLSFIFDGYQNLTNMRMRAEKTNYHFFNQIDRKVYGRNYYKKHNRVERFVVVKNGAELMHMHAVIKASKHWNVGEFISLLEQKWLNLLGQFHKNSLIHGLPVKKPNLLIDFDLNTHMRRGIGFEGYMLKTASQTKGDCVDWNATYYKSQDN
jgi:hypothetical protein